MSEKTWQERAEAVFGQGCNTYSKRADQYVKGFHATHVLHQSRNDPMFITPDGKRYTDWVCGLGSNLIGCGYNYSLPTTLEVVLAEKLQLIFPFLEKMRFFKTGSAACDAAVRVARAWQEGQDVDRKAVIGTGYHGSGNAFIACEQPGSGTADEGYYKLDSFERIAYALKNESLFDVGDCLRKIAAVIVEPVQLDLGVRFQLEEIRRLCTEHGVILIFDEIITGMRFPNYCVANHWGIVPDLACFGKALANGAPLAIMGGRRDILDNPDYFLSNTHNGEAISVAIALETLSFIGPGALANMWECGGQVQRVFNSFSPRIQLKGYPTRAELQGTEEDKAIYMQEMARRGQWVGKAWFYNLNHNEIISNWFLQCAETVIKGIEAEEFVLEGKMPRPIFSRNP